MPVKFLGQDAPNGLPIFLQQYLLDSGGKLFQVRKDNLSWPNQVAIVIPKLAMPPCAANTESRSQPSCCQATQNQPLDLPWLLLLQLLPTTCHQTKNLYDWPERFDTV